MAANITGERTLFCCGAAYQAVQQYSSGGDFVLPRGYRAVAVLGTGSYPYLGYVMEAKSAVVVALRGTKNVFDLLTDFNWTQMPYPYVPAAGATHRGFTELYERTLRPQLTAALGRLSPKKRLIMCGHSLGGALVTLAAPDMARHTRFGAPLVYTYGSPKVGNAEFAAAYGRIVGSTTRVAGVHDLVPGFPPSAGKAYVPVGRLLTVSFRYANPVANHDIRSYAAALRSLYPLADERLRMLNQGFLP
ncbi:lipase family protein [Gordoniibacillus kamchatkensis]|uniref:lipase family protein n=1 Tax=Gordoniibacillus kamchatkensis TaxID=1590651 RepID=UPI0006961730|nr:lipase family protein [Paenibacillus sp. VKM B-2647]